MATYVPPSFVKALVGVCCYCRKAGRGLVVLEVREVAAEDVQHFPSGSAKSDGLCRPCLSRELGKLRPIPQEAA